MERNVMDIQSFNDVFDALEDTPQAAANLRARADMMRPLIQHISFWDVTQEEAADRLGVTRPRLNDLVRGKLGKFSLDALVNLTTAAGLILQIRVDAAA
jgi:predicted XRE-type DNA-binding protein